MSPRRTNLSGVTYLLHAQADRNQRFRSVPLWCDGCSFALGFSMRVEVDEMQREVVADSLVETEPGDWSARVYGRQEFPGREDEYRFAGSTRSTTGCVCSATFARP